MSTSTAERRARSELAAAGLRRDALEQCEDNTTDAMTALVMATLAIAREEPKVLQQRLAALRTIILMECSKAGI